MREQLEKKMQSNVQGIKISSIYTLHLPNTCFAIKKDTDKFKNLLLSITVCPTFVGTTSCPRPTESLEEAPRVFGYKCLYLKRGRQHIAYLLPQ